MKKMKIAVIGAGSNEVIKEIQRTAMTKNCGCTCPPMKAELFDCDARLNNVNQKNNTISGTFKGGKDLIERLNFLSVQTGYEISGTIEPKEAKQKSRLDFEKPKSQFHK